MYLIIIDNLLNNLNILFIKINLISNIYKNCILLLLLLLLINYKHLFFKNLINFNLILLFCAFKLHLIPALTNTLFLIHPPLLYMSLIYLISCIYRKYGAIRFSYLLWFGFSIVLGGYWSLQELSWGGWWNWDVLECGILYIFIITTIYIHFKYTYVLTWIKFKSFIIFYLVLIYGVLNKIGIATSIHAFIASNLIKQYYVLYFFLLLFIFISKFTNQLFSLLVFSLLLFIPYVYLKYMFFLKWVTLYTIGLVFLQKNYFLVNIYTLHKKLLILILININFNFLNSNIYTKNIYYNYLNYLQTNSLLWFLTTVNNLNKNLIWSELWLCKPKYLLYPSFHTKMSRGFTKNETFLIFFK